MTRQDRLVQRYVRETGIWSVYVAGPASGGPVQVGADQSIEGPGPGNRTRALRRAWCAAEAQAASVVTAFDAAARRSRIRPNWYNLDVVDAFAIVSECAARVGVDLTENDAVLRRARELIDAFDAHVAVLAQRGELKAMNRAYRQYRLGQTANHVRAMSYRDWLDEFLADTQKLFFAQLNS